ncbi:uncharacterized protein EV420DRAFT_212004 [Desarmillaria tabescens]|uniref:Uncharacterized protein n=1 Tax=Armillaria tabescens TaxID=1929756 RepID=A0AA39N7J5_ARMTA|nr:uncharacterized protein EV420DRAFT_212004 [Desarmillaria tabescens]KAK0460471.1 hypothetical protein EV420DRAFT_212004 [Desarmillaria tabescens]
MAEYPSLFTDSEMQRWALTCGRGWEGLVRQVCEELKRRGSGVVFTQIKEKFGKLRIYVDSGDEEMRRYLWEMEEKSGKVCETCGAEGRLADSSGWYFATCEECARKRGREFRWLEDVQREQTVGEVDES